MLAVVLSCNTIFLSVSGNCQTGTLDWMVVMTVDSWWLGSVILSSVSLFYRRLSLFASCRLKSREYFFFLIFSGCMLCY